MRLSVAKAHQSVMTLELLKRFLLFLATLINTDQPIIFPPQEKKNLVQLGVNLFVLLVLQIN